MFRFSNSTLHSGYAHHKPSRRRACPTSRIHRKCVAKHRVSAFGLLLSRLVLNNIPVLDQHAIFDANDVRRDPVHRSSKAGESPVDDHEFAIGHNHPRFILQRGRNALDEIEEAVSTRLDVCAMLNIIGRPVTFSHRVIPPVEQRIKSLQDERFVFCLKCVLHSVFFVYWLFLILSICCYCGCSIISLNCVTKPSSLRPTLSRSCWPRSTTTSFACESRITVVSRMKSASGMALGSLLLFKRSVWTHGGAISITSTELCRSLWRNDSEYECMAAFVDE